MNVELLEKVKEHILLKPRTFIMGSFIETIGEVPGRTTFYNDAGDIIKFDKCGTAACIAGWATILHEKTNQIPYGKIQDRAKSILGITESQSNRLFYDTFWPKDFYNRYLTAKSQKQRAQVAAERIDHFIATHGKE
jgi:hypothetical protein